MFPNVNCIVPGRGQYGPSGLIGDLPGLCLRWSKVLAQVMR